MIWFYFYFQKDNITSHFRILPSFFLYSYKFVAMIIKLVNKLSHFWVIAPFFPVWGTRDTWQVAHKRTFVCHPGTNNLKNDAMAQKLFNSLDNNFTQFRNSVKKSLYYLKIQGRENGLEDGHFPLFYALKMSFNLNWAKTF